MKELVIRSIFEIDQDLEEIKETLYNVVKENYDKNIEEIYSIPFSGRKVIWDDPPMYNTLFLKLTSTKL